MINGLGVSKCVLPDRQDSTIRTCDSVRRSSRPVHLSRRLQEDSRYFLTIDILNEVSIAGSHFGSSTSVSDNVLQPAILVSHGNRDEVLQLVAGVVRNVLDKSGNGTYLTGSVVLKHPVLTNLIEVLTVLSLSPSLRGVVSSIEVVHQVNADSALAGPTIVVGYTTIEHISDLVDNRNRSPRENNIVLSPCTVSDFFTLSTLLYICPIGTTGVLVLYILLQSGKTAIRVSICAVSNLTHALKRSPIVECSDNIAVRSSSGNFNAEVDYGNKLTKQRNGHGCSSRIIGEANGVIHCNSALISHTGTSELGCTLISCCTVDKQRISHIDTFIGEGTIRCSHRGPFSTRVTLLNEASRSNSQVIRTSVVTRILINMSGVTMNYDAHAYMSRTHSRGTNVGRIISNLIWISRISYVKYGERAAILTNLVGTHHIQLVAAQFECSAAVSRGKCVYAKDFGLNSSYNRFSTAAVDVQQTVTTALYIEVVYVNSGYRVVSGQSDRHRNRVNRGLNTINKVEALNKLHAVACYDVCTATGNQVTGNARHIATSLDSQRVVTNQLVISVVNLCNVQSRTTNSPCPNDEVTTFVDVHVVTNTC